MIGTILKVLVIALSIITFIILFTGIILDMAGYYNHLHREDNFMENDEFDYGHNVEHTEKDNQL